MSLMAIPLHDPEVARLQSENARLTAALPEERWQPIETVPRDKFVDLWIVGADDWVDFYAPDARKVKDKPLRHGRATHYKLCADDKWRSNVGLGYAMAPEVTPTHWRLLPLPPASAIRSQEKQG